MTTLKTTFDAMLLAKGQELAEVMPADASRQSFATVAYALGIQTALELSQLDPEVARELITEIHTRQASEGEDGLVDEQNGTALDFLRIYHRS